MSIVEFNNVHRAYKKGQDVLKGVTFSIEQGEVVGLLGKNGAGKTTLIRIAMGMIEAQTGGVSLFGLDPRKDPLDVKRRVGYVSEDQVLPPFLRAGEVLELHRGLFPGWDDNMARELSERFKIPLQARINTLSKGQARQVALLCAVAHKPELLLLDEPAGGLDPAARREFLETSIRILNETGTTILFSSHYMNDVERLARRVVLIHRGRILIDSDMDGLREEYSIARLPLATGVGMDRILALEACMAARERARALHAVFKLDPSRAKSLIETELNISNTSCHRADLEEMFIELVGGQL